MKTSLVLLGALAAQALAAPTTGHHYTLHERRDALPASWTEGRRLDRSVKLPMRIGLSQSNLDRGHDLLMDVSHPKSSRYGQYFSPEEIHDLFAPAQKGVDSVREWLESMGIAAHRVSQSTNKQWLQFDAHPDEVENLLRTEYYTYSNEGTGKSHVACQEYHVPKHVQEHIDFVKPGIHGLELRDEPEETSGLQKRTFHGRQGSLPPIIQQLTLPIQELLGNLLGLCGLVITPPCISALYNVPQGSKAAKGNELGIYEDLGDIYSQEDLDLFFTTIYSKIPTGTHPELKAIDGAEAPANSSLKAGTESNLDFQISYPLIYPQNSVLFQTDDPVYEASYNFPGFLNNFLDGIDGSYCSKDQTGAGNIDPTYPHNVSGGYKGQLQCGVYKPTNVISISYGGSEADLPISYQRRQCSEFMKLGLQGVSVVVASGDTGVAGSGGDPRPSNCLGNNDKVFAPDFPATCPYLTTAGGTYLPPGADASTDQEQAVSKFPSGGGFSNIYKRADYQKQAVEDYFAKHDPNHPYYESVDNSSFAANGGIYNRIGRGYPDVAAVADNVLVYSSGLPSLVSGTSAAAPVFASILTRINEERLAKGKGTIGFVNPVLYQHPEVFNDITTGSNSGCGVTAFEAVPGWDPVTGLGTPNYPKLLDVFLSQP